MKQGLWKRDGEFVEMSSTQFENINVARLFLEVTVGMEEKFDLVLANYVEYEKGLLDCSLDDSVFRVTQWRDYMHRRQRLTQHLLNLLSAFRTYLDQGAHLLGAISNETFAFKGEFERLTKIAWEHGLGYRVMYETRNYTQHRGMPIYRVDHLHTTEEGSDGHPLGMTRTIPYLNVNDLDGFKESLLEQLRPLANQDGNVPLTPLVRDCVEGVAFIQDGVRRMTSDLTDHYMGVYEDVLATAGEAVALGTVDDDEKRTPAGYVFRELPEYRSYLTLRNSTMANLRRRFVSSEDPPRKPAPPSRSVSRLKPF